MCHIFMITESGFLWKYRVCIPLKIFSDLLLSTQDISQFTVGQRGQVNTRKAESVWSVMSQRTNRQQKSRVHKYHRPK